MGRIFIWSTVIDMDQLLMLENEDIIKEVKDKCRRMFEDKFFNQIRNSSRLLICRDLKNFGSRHTPCQSKEDDGRLYTEISEYALYA